MSRRGKKLRRYMGYVGVALCEMRDGTCEADPEHRRCLDVPKEVCKENFKYKKIGQLILG